MKKAILIVLSLTMLFCTAGCGPVDNFQKDKEYKELLAGTCWIAGDESYMVFEDEENYIWYQDRNVVDDNYVKGAYEFYMGKDAYLHLTDDLKSYGVTADELDRVLEANDDYDMDNLVCLTVHNDSFILDGEETLKGIVDVSYFGFLLEDGTYLDICNMNTGSYYGFTKE